MEIRFTDADGFETSVDGADFAVIAFSRREIELGRVGSALERLMLLSDRAEYAKRFAGRVSLMFDGYDDDPRALPEIPECTRFFREVDAQWGYWLHFLMSETGALQLAVLLRMDVKPQTRAQLAVGYELVDPEQLAEVVDRWFIAMNLLHDAHGIDESFNKRQTNALLKVIDGWI